MNKKVVFNECATYYSKEDLLEILQTLIGISNSDQFLSVSEVSDTHRRKTYRNKRKVKKHFYAEKRKPFIFISCLN